MSRPNWDLWFMRHAYVTAERGSCTRKQVGAIIVRDRDRRVISGGYNGAPRGMPDCLEAGCDLRMIDGRQSCVRTIHAESNALDLCGAIAELHTLYTTVIPCRLCALRIIQAGIYRVVYHEFYQSQGTLEVEALFNGRVGLVHLDVPLSEVKASYGEVCRHPERICPKCEHGRP